MRLFEIQNYMVIVALMVPVRLTIKVLSTLTDKCGHIWLILALLRALKSKF